MSTKTTFKRIALVAVAALGLGVLSVAPSQADVSGLTVTVTDGTATTFNSDSTTAAKIKVQWLALAGAADSVTVSVAAASALPTGAAVPTPQFMFLESTTSVALAAGAVRVDTTSVNVAFDATKQAVPGAAYAASLGAHLHPGTTANGTYSATMRFWLNETTTASTTIVAGTYNYNAIVTTYSTAPGSTAPITQVVPFKITVSAAAAEDTLVNASKSFAKLTTSTTTLASSVASGTDAVVTGVATAGTVAGYLYVGVRNADGTKYNVAEDSLTVTLTGPGLVCDGSTCGKSLIKIKSTGDRQFSLVGDGSAGTASVVVTTTANTYAAKSVNFYAKSATTITTSIRHPLLRVGTNSDAIQVTAVDAAGAAWTGKAYIVASSAADALIAGSTTPVACTDYSAANGTRCSITAIAPGTAKFKVIDADTVAGATATSAEFAVTVSGA